MQAVNKALQTLNLKSKGEPPKEPSAEDVKQLREKYEKAGQEHVFQFYDELDVAGKAALYEQVSKIPEPEYVNQITKTALQAPSSEHSEKPKLEPLAESASASILDTDSATLKRYYDEGLDFIANNQVGVVLMAGGQGTRLGSSAPKGCYNIGLPSQKSLFQLQAERIYKIQEIAAQKHGKEKNVVIPWYIMTSGPTRKPTEQFFEEHKYFGLDQANVFFFEQGILPCISNEGKIILEDKSRVRGDMAAPACEHAC